MNTKDMSLEDLLTGLDEPAPDPVSDLDNWLESQGIYPGTTRTPATQLHNQYKQWCEANSLKPLALRVWGKEMITKFKRTRDMKGVRYWISRKKDPTIPKSLAPKTPHPPKK